uniref:RING-type E3 ubiquitin transferase n=1 Tax=Arcella intermedia TaxID=1963864 RepID=A0A6B2LHD8_9EUKA
MFPFDDEQNEKHIFECQEMRQLESELEQSKLFKCEICKNNVFESNNRFGLLTECSHCFCLQCIKDWRSETQKSECPVCNIVSHFVVPSNIMVTDKKRKNYIIQNYKEKMRQIPCKYFDGGKGTCKFGTNCHYSHIDESAPVSMDAPIPLNDYSTFESKNRIITDAQGEAVSVNAINLGMFLPEIIQKDFKSNKKHPEEKKTEERTKK